MKEGEVELSSNSEPTEIQLEVLRTSFNRLLAEIERRFGERPKVPFDYYWTVALTAAYQLGEDPERHIECGQLSEDLEELRASINDPETNPVIWHDLDHLIGVLRALAAADLSEQSDRPRTSPNDERDR